MSFKAGSQAGTPSETNSSTSSSAPSLGGGGGGGGGAIVSGPAIWKRFELRGITIGTPRKTLVKQGFTCGERANSRCYKVMDDRCKNALCEFKEDLFGQWFELNGAKTPDLGYMTCATTETDSALVHECRLQINPRQLLTKSSALGKALIGKYGEPVDVMAPQTGDPEGGGRLIWWNPELTSQGPNVQADCNSMQNQSGFIQHYCTITVGDWGIAKIEGAKQEKINTQKMQQNQPTTAPPL